jgi:hypothetical protein
MENQNEQENGDLDTYRRVSYSQYALWMNCPLSWKLKYVDGYKDRGTIHTVFGSAVHSVIQEWMELWYQGNEKSTKKIDLASTFKDVLFSHFKKELIITEGDTKTFLCDRPTLEEFYNDGVEILDHVQKNAKQFFPYKGAKLLGCEIPLHVPLKDKVRFVGFIDMVVEYPKEKKIIIYDFKTSTRGWNYEKKDPKKLNQLLLYKNFYSKVFEKDIEEIEVQFIILKRKISENSEWKQVRVSSFEPPQAAHTVRKAVGSFNQFLEMFENDGQVDLQKIQATPSEKACRWCVFKKQKNLCPVGIDK